MSEDASLLKATRPVHRSVSPVLFEKIKMFEPAVVSAAPPAGGVPAGGVPAGGVRRTSPEILPEIPEEPESLDSPSSSVSPEMPVASRPAPPTTLEPEAPASRPAAPASRSADEPGDSGKGKGPADPKGEKHVSFSPVLLPEDSGAGADKRHIRFDRKPKNERNIDSATTVIAKSIQANLKKYIDENFIYGIIGPLFEKLTEEVAKFYENTAKLYIIMAGAFVAISLIMMGVSLYINFRTYQRVANIGVVLPMTR